MKIGTDGVLLAAWVNVENCFSALDVGTGSGVISLILAQRCNAVIHGLEIDRAAYNQSLENFNSSPWHNRLSVEEQNFNDHAFENVPDLIISNPPYFSETSISPNVSRTIARHDQELHWRQIIEKSKSALRSSGIVALILPHHQLPDVLSFVDNNSGYAKRICEVITKTGKPPKRFMIEIAFEPCKTQYEKLTIEEGGRHEYSETYKLLTKDFYLHL